MTVSLKLIEDVEKEHGGLYQVAERLLDRTLPLSAMVKILAALRGENEEALLRQPCAALLTAELVDILTPIEAETSGGEAPTRAFMDDMIKKFPDGEKHE